MTGDDGYSTVGLVLVGRMCNPFLEYDSIACYATRPSRDGLVTWGCRKREKSLSLGRRTVACSVGGSGNASRVHHFDLL